MSILSYIIFLLFPIISIPRNLWVLLKTKLKDKRLIFLLSLGLGILAYSYIPDPSKDLYRHYLTIGQINGNLDTAMMLAQTRGNYLLHFIFYLVSAFGVFNLFPLIFVTAMYFYLFLFLREVAKGQRLPKKVFILMMLFALALLSFPIIISNLRQPVAYTMFIYAVFYEGSKGKPFYPGLIIPLFIHNASIFLIFIYLSLFLVKRSKVLFAVLISISIFFFIIKFDFFMNIFNESSYGKKVEVYQNTQEYGITSSLYTQISTYLILIIYTLTLLILYLKKKLIPLLFKSTYTQFVFCYSVLCLSVCNYEIVFLRLTGYLGLFMIPLMARVMKGKKGVLFILFSLAFLLLVLFSLRLQYANFGGYYFEPQVFYKNVASILVNLRNCQR